MELKHNEHKLFVINWIKATELTTTINTADRYFPSF